MSRLGHLLTSHLRPGGGGGDGQTGPGGYTHPDQAARQTELRGSRPCGQRGGQPGSQRHQGGRESFEALELQKPLIFWRPDRHNMGPAETQGPHESGLVPPDSLGLVAMTRAPANTPRWQGAQYAQRRSWQEGSRRGTGGPRFLWSTGSYRAETQQTAPGDLHITGPF